MPLAAAVLAATLQTACASSEGIDAICGPVASEDLARVPATNLLIASGLNTGSPANLYLVDTRAGSARPLAYSVPAASGSSGSEACPAAPDRAAWSIDGINLRAGRDGLTLFAANHGDRHAIELFRIDVKNVSATWIGCVPMPEGTLANAVVPLSNGGLIATSFHDPRDPQAWARMARGEATGSVWEWQRASGWRKLAVTVSGANGLELSADERTLIISAWSGRRLVLLDRASGVARELLLDFLPDNIKRQDDGTLLVAGQSARVEEIAACKGPACPQPWIIARVDPRRGDVTPLLSRNGSAEVGYACAATIVDGTLYFTARGEARINRVPLSTLPLLR